MHLHMAIDLDKRTTLDTLDTDTTWSTTYVKLSEDGVAVQAGDRIVCDCEAVLDTTRPHYLVHLRTGMVGAERTVGQFAWAGCG